MQSCMALWQSRIACLKRCHNQNAALVLGYCPAPAAGPPASAAAAQPWTPAAGPPLARSAAEVLTQQQPALMPAVNLPAALLPSLSTRSRSCRQPHCLGPDSRCSAP
eukprot:696898-Pelagomonas_calceolata.AAC.1